MARRPLRMVVLLLLVGLVSAPVGAAATQSERSAGDHKLSRQDRRFMRQSAQAGLFEVKKSKLALDRSHNRHVRDFAAQMIRDHTKANQELKMHLRMARQILHHLHRC